MAKFRSRAPPPPPRGEQNVSLEEHYARKKAVSARGLLLLWSGWLKRLTADRSIRNDCDCWQKSRSVFLYPGTEAYNNQTLSRSFSLEVRAAQLRKWIADDCVLCVLAGWLHNDVDDDEGDVRWQINTRLKAEQLEQWEFQFAASADFLQHPHYIFVWIKRHNFEGTNLITWAVESLSHCRFYDVKKCWDAAILFF